MCALLWLGQKARQPAVGPELDVEQRRLLEILAAAEGPVTFAALREKGIENPATLCYELELAGVELIRDERVLPNGSRVAVGVALPPGGTPPLSEPSVQAQPAVADPPADRSADRPSDEEETRELEVPRPPRRRRSYRRLVGALLGAAACGLVGGLAAALPGAARHGAAKRAAAARRLAASPVNHLLPVPKPQRPQSRAVAQTQRTTTSSTQTTETQAGSPGPSAAQLEEEGHRLLEAGRYAEAIAKLKEAVAATGGSPSRCAHPETPNCLTYAYALYDLGRALQQSHKPAQAVPVLRQRLQIENQRPTVEAALVQARREASPPAPRQPAPKPPPAPRHHKPPSHLRREGETEGEEEATRSG